MAGHNAYRRETPPRTKCPALRRDGRVCDTYVPAGYDFCAFHTEAQARSLLYDVRETIPAEVTLPALGRTLGELTHSEQLAVVYHLSERHGDLSLVAGSKALRSAAKRGQQRTETRSQAESDQIHVQGAAGT